MGRKPITKFDSELHDYFKNGDRAWVAYTRLNLRFRIENLPDALSYNTVQKKYKKWRDTVYPWEQKQYELPHEVLRKTLFRRNKKVENNNDNTE